MYDLILPIGERCHTKEALKTIFPNLPFLIFDALGAVQLSIVKNALTSKFSNFLLKNNLEYGGCNNGADYFFRDKETSVRIGHLFKCNLPVEESFEKYYPLLQRLMQSTQHKIDEASHILMVHCTNEFSYTVKEVKKFCMDIRKLYPAKKVDFLFVLYNHEPQIKQIYNRWGITVYTVPYHPKGNDPTNMQIWANFEVLKECLWKYFQPVNETEYKILGFVPLFSYKIKGGRTVIKIFGIPVWKIRKMENGGTTKYYLCGIPLLKISKKNKFISL